MFAIFNQNYVFDMKMNTLYNIDTVPWIINLDLCYENDYLPTTTLITYFN